MLWSLWLPVVVASWASVLIAPDQLEALRIETVEPTTPRTNYNVRQDSRDDRVTPFDIQRRPLVA
jgi:hypothetical protein